MTTFYLCFLAGGAVLPFLNFILGSLSGGTDTDVDADINTDVDMDIDTDFDIDTDIGMDTSADVDMDLDVDTNVDVDTHLDMDPPLTSAITIGFLPTSLMSLSALALIFGAVGASMTLTGKGTVLTFIVAAVSGYAASVAVQTIIKTLKNIQKRNYGIDENELLMYDGKVVDTILPGQLGTVSFNTLKDVHVSYPARCTDPKLKLTAGRIVKAIRLQDGVFTVEPKNKYE